MKKQTAMKQLFTKYGHLLPNVEEEYLALERQQIIDGYMQGSHDEIHLVNPDGEQYFTKTYKDENLNKSNPS